jgi:Dyp-type peroxidase family
MSTNRPFLFRLDRPLARNAFTTYRTELARLQGNILKPHGRDAEVHLFLTFKRRKQAEAKLFLRELARKITSAHEQRAQTLRHYRSHGSELFVAVCLSSKGYRYLGLPTAGFSAEFRHGMKEGTARLSDPPPSQWESLFQKDLHAMVLLAHDGVTELVRELALLRDHAGRFAEVSTELGIKMCDGAGRTIEHFGYVDGRSQPQFFQTDVKKDSLNGHYSLRWDPSAGPNLVLTEVPLGDDKSDWGSYYVFRKLDQNVRRFKEHERHLAGALKFTGARRELAGAMVVGRFEDGTPVALNEEPARTSKKDASTNDFAYPHNDPEGSKCPFFAHVRKTNPRGDPNGETLEQQKAHRIARRGMPYGDPTPPGDTLDALPVTGVGLLFQCYQADLGHQFEFLQRAWANNADLAQPGTGIDPLIGQSGDGGFPSLKFPTQWGKPGVTSFAFHSVVTLKGGEYFFAPSIPFLKSL